MSMFAPAEYPTSAEIEKAIREARRERSLAFAQLIGFGLAAVKDAATLAAPGEKSLAPVTQGTAGKRGA